MEQLDLEDNSVINFDAKLLSFFGNPLSYTECMLLPFTYLILVY